MSRDEIPDYPQYPFPQSGWHRVEVYAAALEQTRRTFLDNLRSMKCPVVKIGNARLVRAEVLIACAGGEICASDDQDDGD